MATEATVRIEPAQPCMVWDGVETCGKPGTIGTISYYSRRADIFIICEACVRATALLYDESTGATLVAGNDES